MPSEGPELTSAALHILVAIGPGERHGYAIMTEVDRMTAGAVRLAAGTLYTTIKRLLAAGLLEETGERPDSALDDQRRRYYRVTPVGRAAATTELRRLQALIAAGRGWVTADRP